MTQKVWPFALTSESSLIVYQAMYANGHFFLAGTASELSGNSYTNKRAVIFTETLSSDSLISATVYTISTSSVAVGDDCVRYYRD